MNRQIFLIAFVLVANFAFGQRVFIMRNSSSIYYAKLSVDTCEGWNCSGKGEVQIFDKKSNQLKQTLESENLFIELNEKTKMPVENMRKLYDGQSAIFFNDFNFDGTEDVAIRNGNNSGYGGPSYDVYVYNVTKAKFILSDELTNLVSENLGMFETDHKRKRLITFAKSGCCWHIRTEYSVVPKKGLLKVYEFEEDATQDGGELVFVTTRELVSNKWKIRTKKYKTKEYYKE